MVYRGGRKANNMTYIIYRLSNGQPVSEWCRENNVPYGSVQNWLAKGLMVDDCCKRAKEGSEKWKKFIPAMYKGKTLKSQFPCGYVSIMAHIRKNHCTVEEAVNMYEYNLKHLCKPKNVRPVEVVKTGERYESIKKCAEAFNVSPTTIRKRIKKGEIKWTLI